MVVINELMQIWIACTGLTAVWLTQQSWKPHWSKYAFLNSDICRLPVGPERRYWTQFEPLIVND